MSDSGSSFEDLARSARLLQAVKYTNVASFTLLIVDYLYTLDLEVQLIWQARWGYGKILYLLSRYQTFFDVALVIYYATAEGISDDACHKIYSVASWATAFGIGWAEAILVLRTFALSGNNRKLLSALSILYVGIYAAVIVVLAIFLKSLVYGAPPLPTVHGCYPVAGSSILFADFALLLVFEATIMVITLVIGIRRFRHTHNRLVTTLYTDGIFYFVLLAFISLGNIIVLLAGPPEFVDLLNTFQRVMHSLLSCRILLHVRKAASDNALPWTARSPSELDYSFNLGSNLRFRHDQTLDAVTEVEGG